MHACKLVVSCLSKPLLLAPTGSAGKLAGGDLENLRCLLDAFGKKSAAAQVRVPSSSSPYFYRGGQLRPQTGVLLKCDLYKVAHPGLSTQM